MWTRDLGTFNIDFETQGDEFIHHIEQHVGLMPMRGSNGRSPAELGPPLRGPATKLELHLQDDGVRCLVVGNDDVDETADQVNPWRDAASAAAKATGHTAITFAWQAVIGTAAVEAGQDRLGPLEREGAIGPISLAPGGVCMRESVGDRNRIDQNLSIRHSFPVIATGQVTTYKWERAQAHAELHLGRVCALLSLATGSLWVPRNFPREHRAGEPTIEIPATSPHCPHLATINPIESEPWAGEITRTEPGFPLPDWFAKTWVVLDRDPVLAQAVHAHYEAMSLMAEHPTTAFLMFVATIEGVGKPLVPDALCDKHSECPHPKPCSQKRFYKALRTVMSVRDADKINKYAYDVRSRTGHEGSLFGTERSFGYAPFSIAIVAFESVFDVVVVRRMQDASARVVDKMLTEAVSTAGWQPG